MSFSDGLKTARKAANLSQRELAEISGVSQQGISNVESGIRSPSESTMRMLADALGYTVSALMGESQDIGDPLTQEERALLADFRQLNREGRSVAAATVRGLAGNPGMKKTAPQGEAVS